MCLADRILSRSLQAFAEDNRRDAFMIAEIHWSDQGVKKLKDSFTLKI